MDRKPAPSSLLGPSYLPLVAASCFLWFACRSPVPAPKPTKVSGSAAAASAARSLSGTSVAPAQSKRDPCEQAADRCACAAESGAALLNASFPERALQALSHAPSSCLAPALQGARAEALAAVERGPEAVPVATSVLVIDAQNRFARRALAIAAIQAKDFQAADPALAKLVSEDPKDADSLYYLALSQRKRDHYNGAREGFLHVLRINAGYVDARYNLVTLTAAAGAAQEAEHHYQELLQIAPVGDPRVIAARTALNKDAVNAPAELPVLHQSGAAK